MKQLLRIKLLKFVHRTSFMEKEELAKLIIELKEREIGQAVTQLPNEYWICQSGVKDMKAGVIVLIKDKKITFTENENMIIRYSRL